MNYATKHIATASVQALADKGNICLERGFDECVLKMKKSVTQDFAMKFNRFCVGLGLILGAFWNHVGSTRSPHINENSSIGMDWRLRMPGGAIWMSEP